MRNNKGQFIKGHNKGIKFSSEHIINLKKNHKGFSGHKHTEEVKKKIGKKSKGRKAWNKGKKLPEWIKKKISDSLKDRKFTDEHKNNLSKSGKGRIFTEEHKQNLSISLKGKIPWNKGKRRPPFSEEWKRKIGESVKGKVAGEKHYNYGKKLSSKTRNKISKSLKGRQTSDLQKKITSENNKKRIGDKNPNWLGGITNFYERLRTSLVYRNWRKEILKRDVVCIDCGSNKNLEVDHINQFALLVSENNIKTLEQARSCESLWKLENGRVLCKHCHKKTNTYSNRNWRKLCK